MNDNKYFYSKLYVYIPCLLVFAILITLLTSFFINDKLNQTSRGLLAHDTNEQRQMIYRFFNNTFTTLESLSVTISEEDIANGVLPASLKKLADLHAEIKPVLFDRSGRAFDPSDHYQYISDREHFKKTFMGEKCISLINDPRFSTQKKIVFSVPIYSNGEVIGGLCASYPVKTFADMIRYDSSIPFYIVNSAGNVMMLSDNVPEQANILTGLFKESNPLKISEDLQNGREGYAESSYDNAAFFSAYAPMNINDWHIVSFSGMHTIKSASIYLQRLLIYLFIGFISCFFIFIAFMIYVLTKSTEKITKERNELSILMNNLPGVVQKFADDAYYSLLECTTSFCKLTGYKASEIQNIFDGKFLKMIHPDDIDTVRRIKKQHLSNDHRQLQYRLCHKQSGYITILERFQYIYTLNESSYYSILLDITESEKVQNRLNEAERTLKSITDHVECGIVSFSLDDNYSLRYANDNYFKMIGYSREELQNLFQNNVLAILNPEEKQKQAQFVLDQLKNENRLNATLKVTRGDGKTAFIQYNAMKISNQDGSYALHSVCFDVTQKKASEEKEKFEEKCRRIFSSLTDEIFYEHNIATDSIIFTERFTMMFHRPAKIEKYSSYIKESRFIMEDDLQLLEEWPHQIRKADDNTEFSLELRLLCPDNTYRWFLMQGIKITDNEGYPKLMGKLTNVDQRHREFIKLKEQTSKDRLTGLYNRQGFEEQVAKELQKFPEKNHAIFIIDLFNFHLINNHFGHLFGDAVLINIAANLKQKFSANVVARLGGDEFAVYLPAVSSKQEIPRIAAEICDCLKIEYFDKQTSYPLSVNVGAAYTNSDHFNYQDLFKNAIKALYSAELHNENTFEIFDEKKYYPVRKELLTEIHFPGDQSVYQDISGQILEMLFTSDDINTTLKNILIFVGSYYQVSRVYIFENGQPSITPTYEFCNTGIRSLTEVLKDLPLSLENDIDHFNEDGIYYCENTNNPAYPPEALEIFQLMNLKATLQVAIIKNGKRKGVVGFDECNETRKWTKDEVKSLTLIARIVAVFLFKLRSEE